MAIAENSDTVVVRFRTFDLYDSVVLENARWLAEEKTLFFHQSTPTIRLAYTKRYVHKNVDLIRQKRYEFKQSIIQEGGDCNEVYVVQSGTLILTKKTKVLGKVYNIQYAVIGPGEMFNEQAIFNTQKNLEVEQLFKIRQAEIRQQVQKKAEEKKDEEDEPSPYTEE